MDPVLSGHRGRGPPGKYRTTPACTPCGRGLKTLGAREVRADFLEEGSCCGAAEGEAPGRQSWHPQDGKLSADGRAPCMIQPGLAAALDPTGLQRPPSLGLSSYPLEPGYQSVLEDGQHPRHCWAADPWGPPLWPSHLRVFRATSLHRWLSRHRRNTS